MKETTLAALERARVIARGKAALARRIGVSPQTVQQWFRGQRDVPPRRCSKIEREFHIDRRWLRPDDWREHWPDLEGLPLSALPDVAHPTAEAA